jgi:peptidoglycan hydrolase-like protein with peptidoglycan-binding domain
MAVAPCKRETWRGVIVCAHSVPKLNAWAKAVGDDILIKPLPGCGSYQTSTTASAGTHAGGGAIDIDARNLSAEQRNRIEAKGRLAGFQVAWERNAISGLWTWHTHALDPSCPNLAKPAVTQVVEFGGGGDGLVGTKPDSGTRENAEVLMQMFKLRLVSVVEEINNDAKVRLLQQAVRRPVDGIWDLQTDIDLRNTRAEAIDKQFDGDYFKKWTVTQRKRMQKSWGAATDGVWGPETARCCKNTVIAIQKALGVVADGIWGTVTDAAYDRLKAAELRNFDFTKPTGAFPYPSAGAIYGPSTPGKPWYSGKVAGTKMTKSQINWQIKRIQRAVGVTADGIYGATTSTRVKAFQKKYRLAIDGATGPQTWNKMVSLNKT